MEVDILAPFLSYYRTAKDKSLLLVKKAKNRTPERLKDFLRRFILPYLSILVVACFVLIANAVQASEEIYLQPNEEVMDLNSGEVAKVVSTVNPYTQSLDEDAVQVVLAMKNEDFVDKPIVTETAQTEVPVTDRKTTITYTVEGGDTLSSIGWKYGLKITTIKVTNNLSSDTIKPGQKLKLPPEDISASYLAKLATQKKVAAAQTPFKGIFRRPTSGWSVSQFFGHTSFESWHTGVDLDARSGTTIFAAASGKVTFTGGGWGGGYGNHIIITHGNGFSTLYGHLSKINVSNGQWVSQGQVIGIMGSTGWSTGTHLHFEIRVNGSPKNPLQYL